MNLIVVITIVVSVSALAIVQAVRNVRNDALADDRTRHLPKVLSAGVIMLVSDIVLGGDIIVRFLADLSIVLLSVLLLNFSIPPKGDMLRILQTGIFISELLFFLYYVLCALGMLPVMDDMIFVCVAVAVLTGIGLLFMWLVWARIYEIKALLKSGTVWAFVNLCVDAVYVIVPLMTVFLASFIYVVTGFVVVSLSVSAFMIGGAVIASGTRVALDSAFVLFQKHERVIVESMKISHVDAAGANEKLDDMYRDVYERIVLYFEMNKPFLNSELTINDVVKVVYSNKVYISRAICHFTGRNFRQFVNYHRVMYSMDLFRRNPTLKVAELANLSGYNSVVSYTSAFRLFMNETPSEWCRKEKTRILKTKI